LINKVRSILGINELVHYHSAQAESLRQLQQLLEDRLPASHEQTPVAVEGAIVDLADSIARQFAALDQQVAANRHELQIMQRILDGRLEAAKSDVSESTLVPLESASQLDKASLVELEEQGLFILGSARSGTTILTKCLNRAKEIFLLEESNCFQHQHIQNFAEFFNDMHPVIGNCRYKGTYVSPPIGPEHGPLGLLRRLVRQYRYAGEKVAIGPHDYPANWKQMYLDFHAKFFLRSKRFLTIRVPNECLWSMQKLFPQSQIPRLIEAWLESLSLAIEVYRVCPNSYLLFFNDFGPEMLDRLSELLEVKIPVPETMLGGNYVRSRLKEGELAAPLAPHAELCHECIDLFEELRANVCPQSFAYSGAANEWEFFDALQRRIQKLVERAKAADPPQRAAA
jgi:hypothetical protein